MTTTVEIPRPPLDEVPSTDIDLHTDENLLDSLNVYARLRELGPVVWLEKYQMYALTRFAEVTEVLKDWETYNSADGVVFNEYYNALKTTSLHTHGAEHDEIKHIESRPLAPDKLAELQPVLRSYAEDLVGKLAGRTTVDAVRDIAMPMPMDIVTNLVGLSDDVDRDDVYTWGVAAFNSAGPLHASRTMPGLECIGTFMTYAEKHIPDDIKPGGWAAQLFENGRAAGWDEAKCRGVMLDYVFPSLDTTIHAMTAGLLLFAQNPEQWQKVRADRKLLKSAVYEIMRLASPAQYFNRTVTRDVVLGGVNIPAGSRVLMMFGSANRDEIVFPDPDRFDVERNPTNMVSWGGGKHACLGKALARMELTVLFDVLADHYERFEAGAYTYEVNNNTRGLHYLELTLIPVGD
ncbi:MAG TPA: cytochrome P450 [Pseudonocardiaceae bacterium]|jgi:cytochrome P450|nr:cytochrome P450 [Pseudonocardiaceae bacterium]